FETTRGEGLPGRTGRAPAASAVSKARNGSCILYSPGTRSLPFPSSPGRNTALDLIADIGATNSRCALLDDRGRIIAPEVFSNADFAGVEGLLSVYLAHRRASDRPRRAALAVAAPITSDRVEMTNIDWSFSQSALRQRLELSRLLVVNDFAAVAWALPQL